MFHRTRSLFTSVRCSTFWRITKQWLKWSSRAEVQQWDTHPEPTELLLTGCLSESTCTPNPKSHVSTPNTNSQTYWQKGNFTRDEWNNLLHLLNMRHFCRQIHFRRHCSCSLHNSFHAHHIAWLKCLHARVTLSSCHPWWAVKRLFFVGSPFWLSPCVSLLFTSSLLYPTCTLTSTFSRMSTASRELTTAPSHNEECCTMAIYHLPQVMSPTSLTISTTQRLLKWSSRRNLAT